MRKSGVDARFHLQSRRAAIRSCTPDDWSGTGVGPHGGRDATSLVANAHRRQNLGQQILRRAGGESPRHHFAGKGGEEVGLSQTKAPDQHGFRDGAQGAPAASRTTTTLICALDNSAATSTSGASAATDNNRERATDSMPLTSKGATARASAAATGGLSEPVFAGTLGAISIITSGLLQAGPCSSSSAPSRRAAVPRCEAGAAFGLPVLDASASHHAGWPTCH